MHPQMVEHVAVLKRLLGTLEALIDLELLVVDGFYLSLEVVLKLMVLRITNHFTFKCFRRQLLFRIIEFGLEINFLLNLCRFLHCFKEVIF